MNKKIKSITLFKYDLINSDKSGTDPDKKGYKYSYSELDEHGNLLLQIKYTYTGEIEEKDIYTFNEKGTLKEEISFLSENEIAEHKTYDYNEEGLLMQAFKHYADGSKDRIQYDYDGNGNLIIKTTLDSEDQVEIKEMLEWENKKLLKKRVYEYDELVLEETNVYDENGNRFEESKWTPEDGKTRSVYFYNVKNELIKSLSYNSQDKLISKTLYDYDESGKPVKAEYESVRSKSSTHIIYDERGNAIEQTETNELGEINNKAIRKYNERNEVVETSVIIDLHGRGLNQEYVLSYDYTYFGD
jgi:YD repeat-containing protein